MKRTIPCKHCCNCAVIQPAGFLAKASFYCEVFNGEVADQDGCTKGTKGAPGTATVYPLVSIKGHEAVNGWI